MVKILYFIIQVQCCLYKHEQLISRFAYGLIFLVCLKNKMRIVNILHHTYNSTITLFPNGMYISLAKS